MLCVWAPPSDQDAKTQFLPLTRCGDDALMELLDPTITVLVRCSSRYDGYWWSGATNEPLATPSQPWITWVWQLDGQCSIVRDQERAESGRVPSWASPAAPAKLIVSPTCQVVPAAGVAITGTGGVLLAVMVTVAGALLAPWRSVTTSLAV